MLSKTCITLTVKNGSCYKKSDASQDASHKEFIFELVGKHYYIFSLRCTSTLSSLTSSASSASGERAASGR